MIRRILSNVVLVAVPAMWLCVFCRIDGGLSFSGLIMTALLAAISYLIIYLLFVIVYRVKAGEPLIDPPDRNPRKLPLWYRVLSKIFR